jgi:hypothetical protein
MSSMRVEDHLPGLYTVAEQASAGGQREFRRLTSATLVLLVVAAAGGLIDRSWAGWISAAAFVASLAVVGRRAFADAEDRWYDGRAAAESAKSAAWKYAVGGAPFGVGSHAPENLLHETLTKLIGELRHLRSAVVSPVKPPDLAGLTAVRSESLAARQRLYGEQRLEDQRAWYARRAGEHRATARRWQWAMIVLQAAGVVGAVLKGVDAVHVDLLSLFATGAASAVAWLGALDVKRTARSYDFAALELESVIAGLPAAADEETWAKYVADAEAAMSREHTMWLARRQDA